MNRPSPIGPGAGARRLARRALALCAAVAAMADVAPGGSGTELAPTVRFESSETIAWDAEPDAVAYDVYKGRTERGAPWSYGHVCHALGVAATFASDPFPVPADRLDYYLVAKVLPRGPGSVGQASGGVPRPAPLPCDDEDGDAVADALDNCPAAPNPSQFDPDQDGLGEPCDDDDDNDGLDDLAEALAGSDPNDPDTDDDGLGDAQEVALGTDPTSPDTDEDGVIDSADNCPLASNATQSDADGDGRGDPCDYALGFASLDGGASSASVAGQPLESSCGQLAIGVAASASFRLEAGWLHAADTLP